MNITLPDEDHVTSPHTGYTRAHWEAAADGLLTAAWRWASPRGARIDLPGPPSVSGRASDGLEGFARTFLAAAFRVAGAGADPHGWLDRYAEGLVAGTSGHGDEAWPPIGHQHLGAGQPMVESASVALGLRLTRPWLWDLLPEQAQDRVAGWLRGALHHHPAPNNWHLFPFTVAGFLDATGRGDADTARVRDRARTLLELWYAGDGWYSDGDRRAFDHYNGWALHLYPVLDDHLAGRDSDYGPRLRTHLESYARLFDHNGAPVHFGRSLTYRFAAVSAVALGAVTGHTPLSPGASRRVMSGALRYFLTRGAVSRDGLLTLGWHGRHASTLQPYSGPGSPYWAAKAFAGLLAPPGHPLWTDREEARRDEDTVLALPAPGLLVQTTADGVVRLHNHGSDNVGPADGERAVDDDPHYGRQAYSTRTGPAAEIADNHLSVVLDGARSVRRRIHPMGTGPDWAASWHRPVFAQGPPFAPGLRVESVTVARGRAELRVHRVIAAPDDAVVEQTGWAAGRDIHAALVPQHGWTNADRLSASTAFIDAAMISRLTGRGPGLYAALATLSTDATAPHADVLHASETAIDVRWPDGAVTHVAFGPLIVRTEAT